MDDFENKIQNNDYMDEIEQLNYRMNDFKRFLSNQLKDIKDLVDSTESIRGELEALKNRCDDINELEDSNESIILELEALNDRCDDIKGLEDSNESIMGELKSLNNRCDDIKGLEDSNESIMGELKSLNNRCDDIKGLEDSNESIMGELKSLKKENKQLKEYNAKNQEILDSYNEHFKLLFYFYDLKPKSVLKNMQDICQEVLNFIVNVCEKHGIEYWLEGGTLLGAVRHGGFLPWDDDIDLGMMRTDYELFIEVFDSELKNHNLEKQMRWKLLRHNDNVLYFIQVSYAGFAVSDIFPYDYIENPPENIQDMYDVEKSKFKSNILEGKSYSQAIDELYSNLDLSRDEKPFVIPGVERPGPSPFHVQNTEELFPLTKVKFNNYEYLAHKNNDYHLKKLYGDWKNLPKVIDRHNRMYKLKERENINEDLEEKANLLREINNSFNS